MQKKTVIPLNELLSVTVQLVYEGIKVIHEVQQSKDLKASWKGKNDPLTIADIKCQTLILNGLGHHFPQIKIVAEEDEVFPGAIAIDYSAQKKELLDRQLFPLDLTVDLEDLTAFVDPLDGTMCFVNGWLEYVTVLVGFAVKGRPVIGVIGQIWSLDQEGKQFFDPRVFLGYAPMGKVFTLSSKTLENMHGGLELQELDKPAKKDLEKEFVVTYSKNNMNEELEKNVQLLNPTRTIKAGATGFKLLLVARGLVDCYFYEVQEGGTKRWDTCAGEALVMCFGGVTTGKDGKEYEYAFGKDPRNLKGVVAMIDRKKHEEIIKITENMPYDPVALKLFMS